MLSEARFGFSLVSALTDPFTIEDGRQMIKRCLADRTENFLSLCNSLIFGNNSSPYKPLLLRAGYSRDRLERLVRSKGLESALSSMAADGVYLDIKEFKGQKPVKRPGLEMTFDASATDIASGPTIPLKSSGSSGPRMVTRIGIAGLRMLSSYMPLMMEGLGARHLPVVLYYPMPSVAGVLHLIIFTLSGFIPAAWFSQVPFLTAHRALPLLQLSALLASARLRGLQLPFPRIAEIRYPAELARWISKNCPEGAVVPTFPGSALHLLQSARSESIKLPRLIFILGGEPLTERKLRFFKDAGHDVYPWYSSVETGRVALGCFRSSLPDDMHILQDRVACINQLPGSRSSGSSDALLITSVHPDSYKFLLNVETGDEAVIGERRCGCLWEEYGLTRHISMVRSYEKLTLEGMTFMTGDIFNLVEETLPGRFGGTPADYQLAEEEDTTGLTRLIVSVNPRISVHEEEVIAAVHDYFREAYIKRAPMTDILTRSSAAVVRREFPDITCSGKILTLRHAKKEKNCG